VRSGHVGRSRLSHEPVKRNREAAAPSLAVVVRTAAARRVVSALLEDDFRLAAKSSTPGALVKRCGSTQPDAVLIELHLDGHQAISELRRVHEALPDARIVIIADPTREHDVRLALHAGVDGLVLRSELERALAPTLRAVLAGQLSLPRRHRPHVEKRALSYREQQVLGLVINGATNRQAADALFLTESTVKGHLVSAFAKLGVRSRSEAAAVLQDPEAEASLRLPPSVWPPGWSGALWAPLNGSHPPGGQPTDRSASDPVAEELERERPSGAP
jgi:DNA-binding NarL/FixJ family response regulator